jgi:phytoene dehydrogenase-like protein
MTAACDGVIIGGGHNGLVCGAYLAKAGQRVIIVERRDMVGGASVSEEIWPGYKVSTAAYTMALLQPRIILELELARHGFEVCRPTPMVHLFGGGKSLVMAEDPAALHAELAQFSAKDADAYPRYRAHMVRLGQLVSQMLWEIPPDPASSRFRSRVDLLRFAWRYRGIGKQFYDLYDALTLSSHDFLKRWFESDEVITTLSFYTACGGGVSGPRSPGSAYILLRGFVRDQGTAAGPSGFIRGGMGAVSDAIARSGQQHGMEIRTGIPVKSVFVEGGKARGVVLEDGEVIRSRYVVSNAPAKVLFRNLVPPDELPVDFLKEVDLIRDASTAFKVHLALNRLPSFLEFDAARAGFSYPVQARIAPSVDYLERAYDAGKYGGIAEHPPLVIMTPSVVDPTVAPDGKHLISIFGQHAARYLRNGGWNDERREDLYQVVLNTLEQQAPDIRDCIDAAQVLSPADLEERFCLPGGHVHHGELSADQIFFRRPVRGCGDYRTPLAGLYQCGASVHPGGGVTGVPGYNAASVILRTK